MSKVRGDPALLALAHPTRKDLFDLLCALEEQSTVKLAEAVSITRYNLYHHLKKLADAGLVENHRDEGRARWWRAIPGASERIKDEGTTTTDTVPNWVNTLPAEFVAHLEEGATMEWIELGSDSREAVNNRKALEELAKRLGLELKLPFTFIPHGVLISGGGRRKRD